MLVRIQNIINIYIWLTTIPMWTYRYRRGLINQSRVLVYSSQLESGLEPLYLSSKYHYQSHYHALLYKWIPNKYNFTSIRVW